MAGLSAGKKGNADLRLRREAAERRVRLLRTRLVALRAGRPSRASAPAERPPSAPAPPPSPKRGAGLPPLTLRSFVLRREWAAAVPGLTLGGGLPGQPELRSTKYFGSPLQVLNKLTGETPSGVPCGRRLSEGDKAVKALRLKAQLERTVRVTTEEVLESVVSVEDTLGRDAVKLFIRPIVDRRLGSFKARPEVRQVDSRLAALSKISPTILA